MSTRVTRRRGGPVLTATIDVLRHAVRRRSWLLIMVVAFALVAVALTIVGQVTLPYLIYPAL